MTETSAGSGTIDDLPPFASLTTDEEREKKAERSSPGTYNVVVNQDSFQHLPEYSDDAEVKTESLSPLRRGSIAASLASSTGRETAIEGIPIPGDPNVVVLPRFEDVGRRNTFSHSSKDTKSPLSPSVRPPIIIKSEESSTDGVILTEEPMSMDTAITDNHRIGQDARYLRQFRHVVWRQVVPSERESRDGIIPSSVNVLETAAKTFPPVLYSHLPQAMRVFS